MTKPLTLISHNLCPYVQRAVISLTEKAVEFDRITIDLANKPGWFKEISPLGKTPVLRVGDVSIFESAVILEYLEETQALPLHPADPLRRAEHRSWIEFGSAILNNIAVFYSAIDEASFNAQARLLSDRFSVLESRLNASPYFDGEKFSLVDAVYGPIFRYFQVFDTIADFSILAGKPKIESWRKALLARPSVITAVSADYDENLMVFLKAKKSFLSQLMPE